MEKHPLYICRVFKELPHDQKIALLITNKFCLNCLTSGHHAKNSKSVHRCRRCQGLHHTLLHIDTRSSESASMPSPVSSNSAVKLNSDCLLMTCKVLLTGPSGSTVEARSLLFPITIF